jgi:hypothetical protein
MTAGKMRFRSMKSNGLPFNGTPMIKSLNSLMDEIRGRLALATEAAWPLGLTCHGIYVMEYKCTLSSHSWDNVWGL